MKFKVKVPVIVTLSIVAAVCWFTFDGTSLRVRVGGYAVQYARYILDEGHVVTEIPKAKKVPMVIILTYQRCGSSFLGNLFGKNPDAFYVYEPLDSLYTAMYGTKEGWNVPSDITHYANGSIRSLPQDESTAVAQFQENLLTCQLDKLPVEFLTHKYWRIFRGFQTGLNDYRDCLGRRKISNKCLSSLNEDCPFRFGDDSQKEQTCRNALWLPETDGHDHKSRNIAPSLRRYKDCSSQLYHKVTRFCIRDLADFCETSSIRAIKTVRGTARSVVPLLYKYPELKIINLVRDPRAVALSRMKLHSSRGLFSGDDFTIEAKLYCETVLADNDVIKDLPKVYSDRIMRVIYDDFVTKPLNYTREIYNFVGSDLPNITRSFMEENTRQTHKPFKMRDGAIRRINTFCARFFKKFHWKWDRL